MAYKLSSKKSKKILLKKSSKNTHSNCKKYITNYNGRRHFLVCVHPSKNVQIFRMNKQSNRKKPTDFYKNPMKYHSLYTEKVLAVKAKKIFVGKSKKTKMTKLSAGYGKKYDGNTFLIQLSKNNYLFIIDTVIHKVKTLADIVQYHSPIVGTDAPLPHAIDKKGNYYLLLEKVMVHFGKKLKSGQEPYEMYWNRNKKNQKGNLKLLKIKKMKYKNLLK